MAASRTTVCVRFSAIGKVQGVWFRKNTAKEGTKLGLRGFVQNEDDRRKVTGIAQGPHTDLEKLRKWLHRGSKKAVVEAVEIEELKDDAVLEGIGEGEFVVLVGDERRWP